MGRDLLWAKDIAFYGIPTLIGPAASIWGVYFGPLWYYFLAIPLRISNGNPLSAVFAVAISIVVTGFLAYVFFKKVIGKFNAFILLTVILFGSNLINISTFSFHANLLPLLTLLLIFFCYRAVVSNSSYIVFAFLTAALMFHADPAPAVVFSLIPAVVFVRFKLFKKDLIKLIIFSALAYTVPFIPQIIFELRNNFIETNSLIAYFQGNNPSLSGQLPILPRILNRVENFFEFFSISFTGGNKFIGLLTMLLTFAGIYRFSKNKNVGKNQKVLFDINIIVLSTAFLIFTILFTVEIKNWYLFGISIPLALLLTFAIYPLKRNKIAIFSILSFYVIINTVNHLSPGKKTLVLKDPAQLSNQLNAVETIYSDAKDNTRFSVYIFTPPIYDLNYQYLFWWQGIRLKKGLPNDFAYLPNQPDYVRNKKNYQDNPIMEKTIYLIIENSQENVNYSKKEWLNKFKSYKIIWEKNINNAVKLQKRSI